MSALVPYQPAVFLDPITIDKERLPLVPGSHNEGDVDAAVPLDVEQCDEILQAQQSLKKEAKAKSKACAKGKAKGKAKSKAAAKKLKAAENEGEDDKMPEEAHEPAAPKSRCVLFFFRICMHVYMVDT